VEKAGAIACPSVLWWSVKKATAQTIAETERVLFIKGGPF
jgi:hypothetical protein